MNGSNQSKRANRGTRHACTRIGAWGGGFGAAALVALLLAGAPLASASSYVVYAPPYTAFTSGMSNSVYSSGCASSHEGTAPVWSTATGKFSIAGTVSISNSSSCSSSYYSYGAVQGTATINSPTFYRAHSGYTYIYIDWNQSVKVRAQLAVGASTGNYSFAYASVTGTVYAYLADVTNGSYYTYVTYSTTMLFGATLTSNGLYVLNQGWTTTYTYLYAKLHAGHTYQVQLDLYVDAYAELYDYSGTALTTLGVAGSHGITLQSLSVYNY